MDKATVVEEVARSMRKSLAMNACSQVIDLFDALQSLTPTQ